MSLCVFQNKLTFSFGKVHVAKFSRNQITDFLFCFAHGCVAISANTFLLFFSIFFGGEASLELIFHGPRHY